MIVIEIINPVRDVTTDVHANILGINLVPPPVFRPIYGVHPFESAEYAKSDPGNDLIPLTEVTLVQA